MAQISLWFTHSIEDPDYIELDQQISNVTLDLILNLIARDKIGKAKYGTSLDRTDLTRSQWLDHMTEELLDAAGYAQAAKNKE